MAISGPTTKFNSRQYFRLYDIIIYVAIELYDRNWRITVLLSAPLKLLWYKNWRPKETILCTCATFLLLSYSKFLSVSISLLFHMHAYKCSGEVIPNSSVLLYDPSIKFLDSKVVLFLFFCFWCLSYCLWLGLVSFLFLNNKAVLPPPCTMSLITHTHTHTHTRAWGAGSKTTTMTQSLWLLDCESLSDFPLGQWITDWIRLIVMMFDSHPSSMHVRHSV